MSLATRSDQLSGRGRKTPSARECPAGVTKVMEFTKDPVSVQTDTDLFVMLDT